MNRILTITTITALLLSCARPNTPSDVKLVGVGYHPDEVGPSPTPYGGVVEYDHVDFAGAGLPLALMGLGGTDGAGPELSSFEPPYSGIFGFSYIFDQKLPAADTLSQIGAAPPEQPDSCYTAFDPSGPIGSFTTVDVGDKMVFSTGDQGLVPGAAGLTMGRVPADYPPDAQDLFVYYIGFEAYAPTPRVRYEPDPNDPTNPAAMREVEYKRQNYPFGQEVEWTYPGGFARFDQAVSSLPQPSTVVGTNTIQLPDELGSVALEWTGPRYDTNGDLMDIGLHQRCFEFYQGRTVDGEFSLEDCAEAVELPTAGGEYNTFGGQMYTGPWEADEGVTFKWDVTDADGELLQGDEIVLSVRWMAPVDRDDPQYAVKVQEGSDQSAQACEEDFEFTFDEARYTVDGDGRDLVPSLRGDPFNQTATVTCLLENDGEFTLTRDHLQRALEHVELTPDGADGVVFFFSRGNSADASEMPPVKDQFGQKRVIDPVKLISRTIRIGRFQWDPEALNTDGSADGGAE